MDAQAGRWMFKQNDVEVRNLTLEFKKIDSMENWTLKQEMDAKARNGR